MLLVAGGKCGFGGGVPDAIFTVFFVFFVFKKYAFLSKLLSKFLLKTRF